jgi:GTPase
MKEQFIDRVKIFVKAGDGGNGCMSFRREKFINKGGPDGGTGGDGGSVYLEADGNLMDFLPFKFKAHFKAGRGEHGKGSRQSGKKGEDCIIAVPRGTIVYDPENHDALADITVQGERYCAAKGGRGGRGNAEFATSTKRAPQFAEKGEPGLERWIQLELKLLADVGIIGFPNAGKSTLLSKLTAATPKIASYPFTTLYPNLGVASAAEGDTILFADVPGLIEGAHEGQGLGLNFLRHIERTKLLLHLIDISETGISEPFHLYDSIHRELELYNPALRERPELIAFNKTDLCDDEKIASLREAFKSRGLEPYFISSMTGSYLPELREHLFRIVKTILPPVIFLSPERISNAKDFRISRKGKVFIVEGRAVEKLVAMADLSKDQAVHRLQKALKRMGIEDALIEEGAKEGDAVIIGKDEFDFMPEARTRGAQ